MDSLLQNTSVRDSVFPLFSPEEEDAASVQHFLEQESQLLRPHLLLLTVLVHFGISSLSIAAVLKRGQPKLCVV